MTNIPHVIETAILLLVAFLIGCVLGMLVRKYLFPVRPADEGGSVSKSDETPVPLTVPTKPAQSEDGKPDALDAPRDGKKDDLKQIKGIGPRIEKTLNEMGIFHFDQIAAWDRKTVDWVDEYLSFKGRIDREEWIKQAQERSEKN